MKDTMNFITGNLVYVRTIYLRKTDHPNRLLYEKGYFYGDCIHNIISIVIGLLSILKEAIIVPNLKHLLDDLDDLGVSG